MKKFLGKYWKTGLTLLLGVAVFAFWRLKYAFALAYQEQFQLFLFDTGYLCQRLGEPGGLARYVGEALVQFYNNVTLGAAILAVVLMLMQRLAWRIVSRGTDGAGVLYPLTFLPAIVLWYAMGDESLLLSYAVALLMVMLPAAWPATRSKPVAIGSALLLTPLLYWAAGPLAWLYMVLLATQRGWRWLWTALLLLVLQLLSARLLPYPAERLWMGLSYYRFPTTLPYVLVVIPLLVWALAGTRLLLPRLGSLRQPRVAGALTGAAVALTAVLLVPAGYEQRKYSLIEYDYLVRLNDWNAIIQKSTRQQPDLPMSVCATNLALAMTGQLGDRALDFYQHGSEGLLPKFERNFTTAQLTGEVYFHLGLINTAQRFAFESMEALPNYSKSARAVKRLAETNLINGQYDVARKYLHLLQKTVFYRPWALRTEALLADEAKINAHPLYGRLRQSRLQDDFLFSEQEIDKICGQLFVHNPKNTMAMQYLLMCPLLDGDANRLMMYLPVVQQRTSYYPRCVQQAVSSIRRRGNRQP